MLDAVNFTALFGLTAHPPKRGRDGVKNNSLATSFIPNVFRYFVLSLSHLLFGLTRTHFHFIYNVPCQDQSAGPNTSTRRHNNMAHDVLIERWPGGPVAAGRGCTGGSGPGGGAVLLLPLLSHADGAHSERFHCPLKKRDGLWLELSPCPTFTLTSPGQRASDKASQCAKFHLISYFKC
jgi:hypothetical protein